MIEDMPAFIITLILTAIVMLTIILEIQYLTADIVIDDIYKPQKTVEWNQPGLETTKLKGVIDSYNLTNDLELIYNVKLENGEIYKVSKEILHGE